MNTVINIILGIWSGIASFLSPVWLFMVILHLTGLIYQYDYSMDEGTAVIMGLLMLFFWVVLAMIPCIGFLKRMRIFGKKALAGSIIGMGMMALLCMVIQILRFIKFV